MLIMGALQVAIVVVKKIVAEFVLVLVVVLVLEAVSINAQVVVIINVVQNAMGVLMPAMELVAAIVKVDVNQTVLVVQPAQEDVTLLVQLRV